MYLIITYLEEQCSQRFAPTIEKATDIFVDQVDYVKGADQVGGVWLYKDLENLIIQGYSYGEQLPVVNDINTGMPTIQKPIMSFQS
jgi:hypothetical protein